MHYSGLRSPRSESNRNGIDFENCGWREFGEDYGNAVLSMQPILGIIGLLFYAKMLGQSELVENKNTLSNSYQCHIDRE